MTSCARCTCWVGLSDAQLKHLLICRKHIPPMVLVGTQSDLREDVKTLVQLAQLKEQPVSEHEAKRLANQLGCHCYIESSSLTQKNLKEVFDEAIVAGLRGRRRKEKKMAAAASAGRDRTAGCFAAKSCVIM